ncbi:MAG TPA: TonB-dependent receptor, partial [Gemmatimonadales bacterium]
REEARAPAREAARGTAVVRGVVRAGDTGLPVPDARVEVVRTGTVTRTDADGRFRVDGLVAGPHAIRLRHVGFLPVEVVATAVDANDGVPVPIVVTLERAPVPLERVIVTPGHYGVLRRDTAAARTLTREQLLSAPQLGEDLFRVVGRLPGVSAGDFSAAFSVRGAWPEELLVTLDGVRLYEPFHLKDLDGALSIVDIGAVGGVDLATGGFGARHGDGLSGAMEIHTIDPEPGPPSTEVALTLTNLRATSRGRFAGDRGAWLVSARRGFLEYALRLAGEGHDVRPRYQDLLAKVTYEPAPGHELALHALLATDGLRFTDPVEPTLVSGYGSRYLWGSWDARLGERTRARTVLSAAQLDWSRDGERISPFGAMDLTVRDRRDLTALALRHDWTFEQSPRAVLSWGVEARRLAASHDYARGRMVLFERDGRLVVSRDSVHLTIEPAGTTIGAYLAQRLRPFDELTLELGVRADRHAAHHAGSNGGPSSAPAERTANVVLGPRASAAWSPATGTTLRAAWGRYARGQGAHELQVGDGLTGLFSPDLAEHRVVGVEHDLAEGVTARLEAYDRVHGRVRPRYVSMEDALDVFPETGPGRELADASSSRASGVELFVARDAGGPLSWWASYALARSADLVDGRRVPSPLDQRHTFTAGVSYRPDDSWLVSVAGIHHSGWPTTPSVVVSDTLAGQVIVTTREFAPRNSDRLPPYHRVDVRVTRQFRIGGGRLSAFVDVFNLFDHRNPRVPDPSVLPAFGRRFDTFLPRLPSFGATWQF